MSDDALLDVAGLVAGYHTGRVLHGVDLTIGDGEIVALFGRNGVGKTTLVHAVIGMVKASAGTITFAGEDLTTTSIDRRARARIALVPQGRRVFGPLTVEENLNIARRGDGDWGLADVYDLLPRLAERRRHRGDQLSGGEQQMLAIGRALLGNPRLILLDEPSDGLAPSVVALIGDVLRRLAATGLAALVVEQNLALGLDLADRVNVMAKGSIVYRGTSDEFRGNREIIRRHLGVA